MLAGDAGAAVTGSVAVEVAPNTQTATTEIAFIDMSIENAAAMIDVARSNIEIVLIDAGRDPIDQITKTLSQRGNVAAVHLIGHGADGQLILAGRTIDQSVLRDRADDLAAWRTSLTDHADVMIYGCDVAATSAGEGFLQTIASLTGADVAASNDKTGHVDRGANWVLETTIGVIQGDLIASLSDLQHVDVMLPITIRAAGSDGREQMQLLIDGELAQTWDNVGGDADNGVFGTFTYNGPTTGVTPDQVRVVFTNDVYEPTQNIDYNLRVDSVTLDGTVLETEDPSTFSTGTWKPADGIVPGFRESEWLQGNGYFQYAGEVDPPGDGSEIEIFAAGNENDEQMQLWIDGSRVRTWNDIGGDADGRQFVSYSYTADSTVSADDVRVYFTNDRYVNNGEIDRNLRVDRIVIDGSTYQTEDPAVFSTGTWQNGGVVPGFKQDEVLHVNGYFQYDGDGSPVAQPGVISLASSNFTVNEADGTALIPVVRSDGSDGQVTVQFATQSGTALAGQDFTAASGTVTFGDGETLKNIVVPILSDNSAEPVEQFSVTIDNPGGGASLLVPRTATVSITDAGVDLPDFGNFASVSGLGLNGSARQLGNQLELTPDATNRAGSAFYESPIELDGNGSFRSAFSFQAVGGAAGADGLTFTIQDDPRGSGAIGGTGGSLGYVGITNSVAVEFDTYRNSGTDLNANHVSIIEGSVTNSLRTAVPSFEINGGSRLYAWVDYNGNSDVLAVYLSDSATKPGGALLKTTVDLESVVGETAYVGFTAGTGGLTNSHRIRNWSLDLQDPPQDPPVGGGDTIQGVDMVTGLLQPTAIDWLPNGRMLIAQKGGVVQSAVNGVKEATPFIDISGIVNGTRDRGLLDIAVHPDFADNPYVYMLFTYDPPEVSNQAAGTLGGPDGNGNRAGRLIRVTADAGNDYKTAIAGSEVVLLGTNSTWDNFNGLVNSTFNSAEPPAGENPDGTYIQDFINSDSESHTVGGLAFGTDGNLFVSIGDGASYNRVDVRADRVQDIDSLSGKVLRIDPITGDGVADNPFYNGNADANRSKVYQLGLRNPFRISVDQATGQLFVGDVGWTQWEEINAAGPGANFGWPFYEGGNGTSIVNTRYRDTPEGQAFFAQGISVTAAEYALNHQADGINAIVMGDSYRGSLYGAEYQGDIFFNDLGQGIVRHASVDANGNVTDVNTFATGANVVVAISEGPDGALYYVDLDDGNVGRWELV